jgi:hypothetical protein
MPAARTRGGLAPVKFSPSNIREPARGGTRPEIARSVVLLPAPFAPISATSWPALTSSETPRSAVMPP